ncbi:MAG TPA: hypothetical protein VLN58_07660 [Verrucomicrobiae bacterium]|nr:hypothetical protein [Verrucomicrobiae bacterium]
MADINITGTGTFAANDYTVPSPVAGVTKVSFHSANATSVVCFDNYDTFNTWSVTVEEGKKQDLTIAKTDNTGFTVNGATYTCPEGKSPKESPGYTITMGGNLPGKGREKY